MPGAQRKRLIESATHHLDEKENMLTGKPPKFRNNNTMFHDGLLCSHAEKSKFILTLRDPVQEPANKRAEQTSGMGGERKILAFCPPPPLPSRAQKLSRAYPISPSSHPHLWFPKPRHPALDSQAVTRSAPVCSTPGASAPG